MLYCFVRDRRDLAHRFPFLFGDTIGFCSSPAQRRIDRVQERILIEGFEKAVHGTVSENTRANRLVSIYARIIRRPFATAKPPT